MKRNLALATFILACVVVFGFVFLLSIDVVTSRYTTLAAARADNLFSRGWLPDILPPSATNIRTSNNLDINTSDGEFSFVPSEYSLLTARVQPYKTMRTPFANFGKDATRMQCKGFLLSTYAEEDSIWVFFCKPAKGYCEYSMWLRRG